MMVLFWICRYNNKCQLSLRDINNRTTLTQIINQYVSNISTNDVKMIIRKLNQANNDSPG